MHKFRISIKFAIEQKTKKNYNKFSEFCFAINLLCFDQVLLRFCFEKVANLVLKRTVLYDSLCFEFKIKQNFLEILQKKGDKN